MSDLAHPQLLVHARVLHQRVTSVPAALVQADDRDIRRRRLFLELLGHVVRVPWASVLLAENQVVVLPRLARLQSQPELGFAVLAQELRRLVVEEDAALPHPGLGLRLVQLPADLDDRPLHAETAPMRSFPVSGSRYGLSRTVSAQRKPTGAPSASRHASTLPGPAAHPRGFTTLTERTMRLAEVRHLGEPADEPFRHLATSGC